MSLKTSIPVEAQTGVGGNSGARTVKGKTNECDSVIVDAPELTPEDVRDAVDVPGAAQKQILSQVQGDGGPGSPNGNPKWRTENSSGRPDSEK
jgi:hypothetical protein